MKKILALILACTLALTLAGCKGSADPTVPDTVPSVPETQPETTPPTVPETEPEILSGTEPETVPETEPDSASVDYTALTLADCVKTGYEQVGSYTDDMGNEEAYSYYLPEITLDCPGAKEINESIRTTLQAEGEGSLKDAGEGYSLWFFTMDYTAALENGILSIMINRDTMAGEYILYTIYNLDLSTGEAADRATVLDAFGMTEEEFISKVQAQAEALFLEKYGDGSQFSEDMAPFYAELLEKTRTENDNAPVFLNAEGRLSAVVNIYAIAGAAYYPKIVEIP